MKTKNIIVGDKGACFLISLFLSVHCILQYEYDVVDICLTKIPQRNLTRVGIW